MSSKTLGVIIGAVTMAVYVLACCYFIDTLTHVGNLDDEKRKFVTGVLVFTLILCLLMIVVSGLLIMGITMNQHTLMAPWVYLSIISIVLNVIKLIASGFQGKILDTIVLTIIQAALWYPIYTLYKKMRLEKRNRLTAPQQQQPMMISSNASSYPSNPNYGQVPEKA